MIPRTYKAYRTEEIDYCICKRNGNTLTQMYIFSDGHTQYGCCRLCMLVRAPYVLDYFPSHVIGIWID